MGAQRSDRRTGGPKALPPIFPVPKKVRRGRGVFRLVSGIAIALPESNAPLDRGLLLAAQSARDAIRVATGIELRIERSRNRHTKEPAIVCKIDRGAAIAPRADTARDAYRLKVRASGIELSAPNEAGLRYGLQTLTQLACDGTRVPAVEILDQPDFRDRGLMLDVSRGKVPKRETIEDLIDLFSRLRLNVLMLYVEHTFDFRKHPEIGAGSSPLDAETILMLDEYAANRGVELIPCLQSLGHMERTLSLDRYAHLAENERRWSVSPGRPETYDLLGDLYDEFLPLFRSKRLNANCDEPFDLGRGQSAGMAKRLGTGGVFARHVEKLRRLAAKHDKRLMIWADFALANPEHIDDLDRNNVLLDWWYEADFDADRIRSLRRKGFEVWGCPGTSSWNCLFPRIENAEKNVARWANAGREHGAKGLLNTDWGDFGHYNALGVSFHGYAWGAQHAWSGEPERRAFDRGFDRVVFGEPKGNFARLYRRLGAIHDAGFKIANGSVLQYLYFDPLQRSYFIGHANRRELEKSRAKVDRVLGDIDTLTAKGMVSEARQDIAGLALREIRWAAQATRSSIDKSLAGIDFNAWRSAPASMAAQGRRTLARRLDAIAEEQSEQLSELETLWMARNHVSDFAKTQKRIRRSIRSLRLGARQLRDNEAPRPTKPGSLDLTDILNQISGRKVR